MEVYNATVYDTSYGKGLSIYKGDKVVIRLRSEDVDDGLEMIPTTTLTALNAPVPEKSKASHLRGRTYLDICLKLCLSNLAYCRTTLVLHEA